MNYEAINFARKVKLFDEQWQPKVIAEMNDYQFKIAKLQGNFIWHDHKDTDETFKPYAEHEVKLLLIEPRGVLNTGDEGGDRTAENDVWI